MKTVGDRMKAFRESRELTQKDIFQATKGEIKQTSLSAIENNQAKPGYDTIASLCTAYPDLNPDWLLLGSGAMLRDGRALTPAPSPPLGTVAPEPPSLTSGQATVDHVTEIMARGYLVELVTELKADKADLKGEVLRLREELSTLRGVGKFDDSSDAADDSEQDEKPADPTGPRGRGVQPLLRPKVGFRPTVYQE